MSTFLQDYRKKSRIIRMRERRKVLTPEQQAKFSSYLMRGGFGPHFGMRWREGYCGM